MGALAAWVGIERAHIDLVQRELATAHAKIGAEQQTIAQLRSGVTAQNAGIARLRATAAASIAEAAQQEQARERAAQAAAVQYQRHVQQIAALPVPSGCTKSVAWAAAEGAKLGEGWK
ncbi:MAG: hypothetical protein M0T84_17185 [Betaproteobacteria bacterium]|nr:hypothetical protein [Betaproteobacteria bacterium]